MMNPTPDLSALVEAYELATNSHDVNTVMTLIDEDATYWFTDGSHRGGDAIRSALARTFELIRDETYEITDVEWVTVSEDSACFRYEFGWAGTVDGQQSSGSGRGTNIAVRRPDGWKMLHEHLSV